MKNDDEYLVKSGHLAVGDGHELYYEQWGNVAVIPTVYLHGGPGGGFKNKHKLIFDPKKHHVIFFEQRGCGRSTPFASTENNTTQKLVEDIETIRKFFGFDQIYIKGSSWGSCLALVYAIAHPKNVKQLLIGGVYLGTEFENDLITTGYFKYTYPEAWDRFINMVPKEHQTSGRAITQYYSDKLFSDDEAEALKYADEWAIWESSSTSLSYNKRQLEQAVIGSPTNLPLARLETHYFLNNCFMPEGYILENINKISHIPCYVIQGRFDNCSPPAIAYKLANAYGSKLTLQWVNAGHSSSEPQTFAAQQAAVITLLV